MNSPHSLVKPSAEVIPAENAGIAFPRRDHPRVEDYLDHLCAPLLGLVPYPEREAIRQEARAHLEFLVEEFVYEGMPPSQAVETALLEYGPPDANGQALLVAWWGKTQTVEPRSARYGGDVTTVLAFCAFGLFSVLNHFLLQSYAVIPRLSVLYLPLVCLTILSPIIAGLLVGGLAPVKATRGVCRAMVAVLAHSLLAGMLLLPDKRGLLFALFQLFFWLPVGLLSALGAESLARQHRQRQIWRAGMDSRGGGSWPGRPLAS